MELNINKIEKLKMNITRKISNKSLYLNKNKISTLKEKKSYNNNNNNFELILYPKKSTLNVIPSKLSLNPINNIDEKVYSPSSCPASEDEDESEIYYELDLSKNLSYSNIYDSSSDVSNEENQLNDIRKSFSRIRKYSIHRNNSKKEIKNEQKIKNQMEEFEQNIFSNNEENNTFENKKHKKSVNATLNYNNIKNDIKTRNRTYSVSILETLRNKKKYNK